MKMNIKYIAPAILAAGINTAKADDSFNMEEFQAGVASGANQLIDLDDLNEKPLGGIDYTKKVVNYNPTGELTNTDIDFNSIDLESIDDGNTDFNNTNFNNTGDIEITYTPEPEKATYYLSDYDGRDIKTTEKGAFNTSNTGIVTSSNNAIPLTASKNGVKAKLGNGKNYLEFGLGRVSHIEYSAQGGVLGTRITFETESGIDSVLLTGVLNGSDFSAKATAGKMWKDLENGKTGSQNIFGLELQKAMSDSMTLGIHAVHVAGGDEFIDSYSETKEVVGGKEVTTYTTTYKHYGKTAIGGRASIIFDPRNKLNLRADYTKTQTSNFGFGIGYVYITESGKTKIAFDGYYSKEESHAGVRVGNKINSNWEVHGKGEYRNHNRKEETQVEIGFTYNFFEGRNRYNLGLNNGINMNTSHVDGTTQAKKNYYSKKYTEEETYFIPDPVNEAPIADAGLDKVITVGESVTLNGGGTDTDGTVVAYKWSNGETTKDIKVSPNKTTTYTLAVKDNEGKWSLKDSVTVTVNPVPNKAPVADAGVDQKINEGDSVTLECNVTDTDGTIQAIVWNTGATTSTIIESPIITTDFNCKGQDNNGEWSNTDGVRVTVNKNPTAENKTIDAGGGEIVTFDMNDIIDDEESPDNDLTVTEITSPSHGDLTWVGNTVTYEVTDGSFYNGDDSFTFISEDPDGGKSQVKTFTIKDVADF